MPHVAKVSWNTFVGQGHNGVLPNEFAPCYTLMQTVSRPLWPQVMFAFTILTGITAASQIGE